MMNQSKLVVASPTLASRAFMKRPLPAFLVALLVAGLLLLPACDSGSSGDSGNARLQLNARTASMGGGSDSTTVVEGDTIAIVGPDAYRDSLVRLEVEGLEGRIRFQNGQFITGTGLRGVEGEIDQDGRTIGVSLEAEPFEGASLDMPGFYVYDGWITNLEAGAYRLVVQHEGEYAQEEGDRLTVFDGEVQVK